MATQATTTMILSPPCFLGPNRSPSEDSAIAISFDIATNRTPKESTATPSSPCFFDIPRELRNKIYHELRKSGSFPLHQNDDEVKSYINVAPHSYLLGINRKFAEEYKAVVFQNSVWTIQDVSLKRTQMPRLVESKLLKHVHSCKIELFVPFDARKVLANKACDPDLLLREVLLDGETLGNIGWEHDFDEDDHSERGEMGKVEDEVAQEEASIGTPPWFPFLLSKMSCLESIDLQLT